MTIDDATLQRLIDKGRRNGNRLGIEQLGQDVPVETMIPEEVAALVERLETAGVDVELTDERLKRPRAGSDYQRGAGVVSMAAPAALSGERIRLTRAPPRRRRAGRARHRRCRRQG